MTNHTPQPDTCDYPGCYAPAVHKTAVGTKYCQAHKPYIAGSSGMFKKHDGTEFSERKRR